MQISQLAHLQGLSGWTKKYMQALRHCSKINLNFYLNSVHFCIQLISKVYLVGLKSICKLWGILATLIVTFTSMYVKFTTTSFSSSLRFETFPEKSCRSSSRLVTLPCKSSSSFLRSFWLDWKVVSRLY